VLRRAVSPAPTFPRRRGDELEWRLACVPDQGDRVQAARTDAILAGALALPVGRRLGFEVREGSSVPRLWMVETTLTLAGQLRLTGERASLAAVSGPRAFALYERQGHADPWLDLFALALGLTPLAEASGPWAIAHPSRLVACAALADSEWQATQRARLQRDGARLQELLAASGLGESGGTVLFRYLELDDALVLHEFFARRGILLRYFSGPAAVRFGLPANEVQWQRLVTALDQWKNQ
jgi:hypothetical protein